MRFSADSEPITGRRDQRQAPRRAVNETATLVFPGAFAKRPCRVLDLSSSGARLTGVSAAHLRSTFALHLPALGRSFQNCRSVWSDGIAVGVKFG